MLNSNTISNEDIPKMYIVPFIIKTNTLNLMKITSIKLLTIGGHSLWEEYTTATVETILTINDLHMSDLHTLTLSTSEKECHLCEIDTDKTNMDDFYKWDELNPHTDTFCWRTFYLIGNDHDSTSWLPMSDSDNFYKESLLAILGTANKLSP
jgi:hypothetical protein